MWAHNYLSSSFESFLCTSPSLPAVSFIYVTTVASLLLSRLVINLGDAAFCFVPLTSVRGVGQSIHPLIFLKIKVEEEDGNIKLTPCS
jgi:hypothetical protein